jgi:glucan phosphoethanolaminetransferase (alkaline phosphatase superfamily)
MLYGLVAGQASLIRESISVYVGIVLATTFGGPLYEYSKNASLGSFQVTETMVKLVLLALPVVLLMFAHMRSHTKHHASIIVTLVLAIFSSLLVVSSVLMQLDPVNLSHVTDESTLALMINQFQLAWLGAVPIMIAIAAFFKPRDRHHKR